MKRAHVFISGLVQGVSFRFYARQQAQGLGVAGWVKNRSDGRVEAVIEGEGSKVDQMVEWCRQGPEGARIADIHIAWEEFRGEHDTFEIRH